MRLMKPKTYLFKNKAGGKVRLPADMTLKDLTKLGIMVRLVAPGVPLNKNEYVHNPQPTKREI